MATFDKEFLSGSTGGRQIKVAQTGTPGTTIHATGTSATIKDEIWLYAFNSDSSARTLTLEWGGTTSPDDTMVISVPPQTGLMLLVPGLILSGDGSTAKTVRAFVTGGANLVMISGFVNRITP